MPTLDLQDAWLIRHDPLSQGLADRWWRTPPADKWLQTAVPSAWQTVLGPEARGVAWYQAPLPARAIEWARAGQHVQLRFESVATDCRAWVNGIEVGRHVGDWIPFEFDITTALLKGDGSGRLFVRVDQIHAPRPPQGVVVENGHITKGFHDVLSIQHAGVWGGVSLRSTGPLCIPPGGLLIDADPQARRVSVNAVLHGEGEPPRIAFEVQDPAGKVVGRGAATGVPGERRAEGVIVLEAAPALWSPGSPALYTVNVTVGEGPNAEKHTRRVGFRTARTGGAGNSQILLNDRPLQIRGILHWGHEPRHIAPAPPPDQVRREFEHLRALGFNCVCLCMFYPPEHYYDIADQTGMLLWQEHPVWKSRMSPESMPEYHKNYEAFMRRDAAHASVVIVSGTCEHEAYDGELGAWWWKKSGELLPRTLRQIQTGFLEQTPEGQTDLYDDHVYDNSGRWVCFLADMQARIGELPPKPFVMGETIISNAWPDAKGMRKALDGKKPWWMTHGLDECEQFETTLARRAGAACVERFKTHGEAFAKQIRKFQGEALRMFERNAGFVTNSIRDVPICRIGFMDDLDNWRFAPEDTLPWLSDAVLLLQTPDHLRAFAAGDKLACRIGLSNFATRPFDGEITLRCAAGPPQRIRLSAKPGEIVWSPVELTVPAAASGPAVFEVHAEAPGLTANRWALIALPAATAVDGAARLAGLDFTAAEREPEFEERSYSSGWCIPCRTWKPRLPDTAALLPIAKAIDADRPIPEDTPVLVTHRLTRHAHEFLHKGGRCLLLAHRHEGGMGTKWINLWGQLPLLIEGDRADSPIRTGESEAVLAMLHHDLTKWTTRAVPSDDLAITEHIDPIIRYVYTHDAGTPKLFDAAFSARVARGLLVVSTLDHSTAAGAWMFERLLRFCAAAPLAAPERELDIGRFLAGPAK